MPALHAIHEQEQALLVAQLTQAEQVLDARRLDPALALNPLDENRGRGRGKRRPHRVQIIVGHVAEARHRRAEALLHLFLARGGDARQGAAVEGISCRDDFKAAFVVSESAREFVQTLIRLRAAVAEKNFTRPDESHQCRREPTLRFVVVKV